MEMAMGVSFVTILAATIASWVFGGAYYGLLGSRWMRAADLTPEDMAGLKGLNKFAPYLIAFLGEFVMAYVFAALLVHTSDGGFSLGAAIAAAIYLWLAFIGTTVLVNNRFAMRKVSLAIIDAAHWLGVLVIQALVIALMSG